MIITCPNCHTRFEVPDAALRPSGRKLKCANCGHIWFEAAPPGLPSDTPNLPPDGPQHPDSAKDSPLHRKTLGDGLKTSTPRGGFNAETDSDTGTDGNFLNDQPETVAERSGDVDETGGERYLAETSDEPGDDLRSDLDHSDRDGDGGEDKSAEQWHDDASSLDHALWKLGSAPARSRPVDVDDGTSGSVIHGPKPERSIRHSKILAGLAIILIAANVVWGLAYYFRSDIVRQFPAALDLYSKINVSVPSADDDILFQETVIWHGERDGHRVFEVSGTLYNPSATRTLRISAIRLQLLDGSNTVLQERDFPAPEQSLEPQQRVPFDISLVNPSERRKSYRLQSVSRR